MKEHLKIFSGSSNRSLAKKIGEYLQIPLGVSYFSKFSDGNIYVKVGESVRQQQIFIIQSGSAPVNDNFMELLFFIDAFKRASAASITAVIPFYPYTKGDKKDEPRVSIRAKVIADTLEAVGVDRVLVMDLLPPQIQGFFKVPVDNLYAMPTFVEYIRQKNLDDLVVVSPDIGAAKMARNFARRIKTGVAIGDKSREDHSERAYIENVIGDVKNKNAIIIDDMIISGGSLFAIAKSIKNMGARDIFACITHGLLTGKILERLDDSPITELIVTDTIELAPDKLHPKIKQLSVAKVFGDAIRTIYKGTSMGLLFDEE
jgi:ribose-phosphate pyrophosphokinase